MSGVTLNLRTSSKAATNLKNKSSKQKPAEKLPDPSLFASISDFVDINFYEENALVTSVKNGETLEAQIVAFRDLFSKENEHIEKKCAIISFWYFCLPSGSSIKPVIAR